MKLYSDHLTTRDLYAALPREVFVQADEPKPARLRRKRFDHVRLSTEHGNRWPNSGNHGGGRASYESGSVAAPRSATYDEHGWWMAELFEKDPDLIISGVRRYEGADDFHKQTGNRYLERSF